MKKTALIPRAKKHIPYFRKGELVFQESGIRLPITRVMRAPKNKGQCKLPEQRIKVENLERNFARLAKTFEIPDNYKLNTVKKMIGEILHSQIDVLLESDDFEHDIFDNAIVLMDEDIKANDDRRFRSDLKDAVGAIEKESERSINFVVGVLTGTVVAFAKKSVSEADMGRLLAYLSEKVYLSNDGKIVKIKLNDFGDYAFQYMRENIPSYTKPFKWFTEGRTFASLRYRDIAKGISTGKLDLAIPSLAVGSVFLNQPTFCRV